MPIEIKELIIRATINNDMDNSRNGSSEGSSGASKWADDRELIVAECIDQVMQILKEKNER